MGASRLRASCSPRYSFLIHANHQLLYQMNQRAGECVLDSLKDALKPASLSTLKMTAAKLSPCWQLVVSFFLVM